MKVAKLPTRDELLAALRTYHSYIASGSATEKRADQMIGDLDGMVPHANISDLLFWGERERTDEEVVDEALFREDLWRTGGKLALLLHVRSQLEECARGQSTNPLYRNNAVQELEHISAEIERLTPRRLH